METPTLAVLGPLGLVFWLATSALTFRRAPWWKRIAFAFAAEAMSLGVDSFMRGGDDHVWRLKDLVDSLGRGFGGC